MAYDIAYAEAFNNGSAFVRDARTGDLVRDPRDPAWRLTVPGGAPDRSSMPADIRALIDGKELVPVRAEDLGVEAIDGHTVRFRLQRPVPFFPKLVGHQFFSPCRVPPSSDTATPGHARGT